MSYTTTTINPPAPERPPIGVKPGWLHAVQRISELAGAIQRYAEDEHGAARRFLIRLWAEEIKMQLDIWDWMTQLEETYLNDEDGE